MKLIALIAVSVCLSGALGQKCADEFVNGLKCVMPAFDEILAELPPFPDKAKMEEKKTKFLACFTDNGCADPSAELGKEGDNLEGVPPEMREIIEKLQSLGIVGLDMDKIQKMMAASHKCGQKLKGDIEPLMTKCVASKVPALADFKLPDEGPLKKFAMEQISPDMLEHIHGIDGILPFFGIMGKVHMMIKKHGIGAAKAIFNEKVCDSADKRKAVGECVSALFDEGVPDDIKCANPVDMGLFVFGAKDKLCAKRDECRASASPECLTAFKSIPKALCACAGALMSNKWDDLVAKMSSCVSQETGEELKIPPPVANGLKSMLARKMKDACMAPPEDVDPCAPDFCPFKYMMKQMEKGKGHGKGRGGQGPRRPPFPPRGGPPLPGGGPPQ